MTLIDRLSKLDGPDREVDAEIAIHFGAKPTVKLGDEILGNFRVVPKTFPAYTASVDAAIALAERVEPLLTWGRDSYQHMYLMGCSERYQSNHPIPAIALCIALLRAKEASKL